MNTDKPINTLIELFLSEKDMNDNSKELYNKTLTMFVTWLVKNDYSVKEPTPASAISYKSHLLKKGLSVRTVDSYLASVKVFFAWLDENGIYKNITTNIKTERKTNEYIKGYLSIDQVSTLLDSVKGNSVIDKRNFAVINLMVFMGLRCIEVTRLNFNDIYSIESQYYIRIQGKGRKEKDRELPITDNILKPIRLYWKYRTGILNDNSPMFVNHARCSTKRITTAFISRMVKTSLRNINLNDKKLTAHSLRHSAATLSLIAGCKVYELQKMLGHKSPNTTELYLRALRQDNQNNGAAIFKLDEYYRKYNETGQK